MSRIAHSVKAASEQEPTDRDAELQSNGWEGDGTGITSFPREGHHGMGVQLARLVVFGLEDGRPAHRGFGCRDQGEVAAGEAKEDFPA